MDNACAELVAQDQVILCDVRTQQRSRGVLPDPVTQVATQTATNQPGWEIWTVPYAKIPIIIFCKQTLCPFFLQNCSAKKQISASIQEIRCI